MSSTDQVIQNATSNEAKPEMTEANIASTNAETTEENVESKSSKSIPNDAKPMEDEDATVAQKHQSEKTDDLEKAYFNNINEDEQKAKEVVQNPEIADKITSSQKFEKVAFTEVQKEKEAPSTIMNCCSK